MYRVCFSLLLASAGLVSSCNQNTVQRDDYQLASKAAADNEKSDANSRESQVDEPVMVAGGFLQVRCGAYDSFGEPDRYYGCGVHTDGLKASEARVESVELILRDSSETMSLVSLSKVEPWHVAFHLPEGLASGEIQQVNVRYSFEDQAFTKPSDSILAGEPLRSERLSVEDDLPTPAQLGFPLANPNLIWKADFNQDPTALDMNGDGLNDWSLDIGTKSAADYLAGGVLANEDRIQLRSQPALVTPRRVSVDYAYSNLQPPAVDGIGAELWVNIDLANGRFINLFSFLKRLPDGSQQLQLFTKNDADPRVLLHQVDGLDAGMIRVSLLLDRTTASVQLKVNDIEQGSFQYQDRLGPDTGGIVLDGRNAMATFAYILVEVEQ